MTRFSSTEFCLKAAAIVVGLILVIFSADSQDATESIGADTRLLTDFSGDNSGIEWFVVNDNVMGGRSDGDFEIKQGELIFAGRTNTLGGGFSSIRTRPVQLDLSKFDGIQLRVRGDGRRYTWRLTTNARWQGREVSYWADFNTSDDAWRTTRIPFASFVPRFRGMRLDGPELNRGQINGMGLMIYDRQDGPFELRLASVNAYAGQPQFALEQYRWKNRVLVISAAASDDSQYLNLQSDMASLPAEFADRDLVLVTLLDVGQSEAGGQILTEADVATTRDSLGIQAGQFALRLIGKDGTVKLSKHADASMAEIYSLIDTMPMRQSEISDR